MLSIVWFLVWGTTCQLSPPLETRVGTIQLYQRAVEALQSEKPLDAIPLLKRLAEDEDSKLAPLAAVRLAECYLADNQPAEALQTLVVWAPRTLKLSERDLAVKLDPTIAERVSLLTRSSLAQLPEADTSLIEQYAQPLIARSTQLEPIDGWFLTELARRCSQQQRYRESYELLQRLGSLADAQSARLRDYELPLSIILRDPSPDLLARFAAYIDGAHQLSTSEWVSALLAISDGYRALGDLDAAKSNLLRLTELLQSQAQGTHEALTETANWLATADLRLAEIMVLKGQYRDAAEHVEQSLLKHASYPDLSLFRLVAARCYVAEIEFDLANSHLKMICQDASSKPSQIAQSLWMQGEICVLQRNYPAAVEHYADVLKVSQQPLWHARALLQMAQCHEWQSALLEAMVAYRAIVEKYPESEVASLAQKRLAELLPNSAQLPAQVETETENPKILSSQSSPTSPLTLQR